MLSALAKLMDELSHRLYVLPDVEIVFLFVILTVSYTFFVYYILQFTLGRLALPTDNYFGVTIVGTLTSLNAVLLIFTLVQAINTNSKAKSLVMSEISSVELFNKKLNFIPEQQAAEIRHQLGDYLDAVAVSGWDAMITGIPSKKTEAIFSHLINTIPHLRDNKEIDRDYLKEIFSSFADLVKSRYDRLKMGGTRLPYYYLLAIFFLFTLHILQFFLLTKPNKYSLSILEIHMACLGLLLGIVVVYDHPFEGETSIKPELYHELSLKLQNENNYFGNSP